MENNYKELIEQNNCLGWVVFNHIKGEGGNLLEFRKHSFLIDVYNDWTPTQVIRKGSQVGFSTLAILKSFWAARYKYYNQIYTLPSFTDVGQFVPSKVNAIIAKNPVLQEWVKDKDTIFQKQVKDNFIYYRGTLSGRSSKKKGESSTGIMLTSDLNIHDECDRSDQKILDQYVSRLDASDYKGRWYFSNPSHPSTLSQGLWEKSDQKHWFVKCSHCGKWQYLEYPKSVKDGKYVCKKCGGEIMPDDIINGMWIKKYNNRDISGYWIPQMIASWHTAKEIEEKARGDTEFFYNFVLGLPYRGSDTVIDKDMLARAIDYSSPNFLQGNVLGVDVGLKKHFVLGNKQGIFKVGVVEDWEDIELLIKKYDVSTAVIDALPDLTAPRKLRDKYIGIVWLSYFKRDISKSDFVTWDAESHTVYSDRGKILGLVIDEFADRKIRFQMKPEALTLYVEHWKNVYKIKEIDSLGIEHQIWDTSGENHFALATVYFRLALDKSGGELEMVGEEKKSRGEVPTIDEIIKGREKSPDDWKV